MAVASLGIYVLDVSQTIFKYHFNLVAGRTAENWSYYSDADTFKNSQHQRRIACFQIPYPYNDSIEHEIDKIYDHADAIIVFCTELHPRTINFIRRFDRPKMRWFICGALNPGLVNGRTYKFLDWFTTTIHFYKNIRPLTLYNLDPYSVKPLMFDALLGRKKPHRDQAYNFIKQTNLDTRGIVTYVNDTQINFKSSSKDNWIWPKEGLTEIDNVEWTVDRVRYYGHRMSLSQVIPTNIYNQTAYSLVCETNFENDYVFFTEKTVKPILARRLFILLSHRYALAELRNLGFKTFAGIIDESYDEIEPAIHRHQAALEQLEWLCNQDQADILNQCREIVDHNFNLMYSNDWYWNYTATPLSNILLELNQ